MKLLVTLLCSLAELLLASPSDRVSFPAGVLARGSDDTDAEEDERPASTIRLSAFALDRTEVTRGAYLACVVAGGCPMRAVVALDLLSRLPMTQVSQREAAGYCTAVGARLPSEAEWERAARGASARRRYPWGDELDCTRANFGNYEGEGRCLGNPGHPVEVGRYPSGATPEGVLDLAGNVWEWTADYYDALAYHRSQATGPRAVARGPEELGRAPRRSVRGGACCSMLGLPRAANRVGFPEDYRDVDLGFRCAR